MKKGELTKGKWHFKLGFIATWYRKGMLFHFGIFKLISYPNKGMEFTKENYKGFWFRKHINEGFEISL